MADARFPAPPYYRRTSRQGGGPWRSSLTRPPATGTTDGRANMSVPPLVVTDGVGVRALFIRRIFRVGPYDPNI